MGAYASTEKAKRQRPRAEPQTSARLNKGQLSEKRVGPSGREWIDGDPFLDACRDCGDHSGCKKDKSKKSESGSEDSKKQKKKTKKEKRKEEKKEEKKRKESFQGLKDDLLDALDSRFHDMNKAHQQQQPTSTTPPQPPHPFGGPGMGPSPFTMGGPHHMDPRIAQQMGMMGGEGYRMG
ncbi:hypothetical protein PtrV1_08965 [Pyrenophora tritici-repentis]|uniref:Uncharacterized protein n=1 Tax=Pyrenophora tritici-repentis TaxID=45151 RepID=A0A2W1GBI0_9PLEO|nr:hypothetical protein PtrV1_08965 [Pyrenophora tritici-repentis]KAF7441896.1 hypothetical protein A1F99_137480 [Pyrenophora tritici-repentis]KAF7567908.1 hypothetical protein PtrM4_125210 [Pyrenophora tritici-repentis]PZC96354.1 hypothetical protein A1F95_05415 [Pyrenophora tritici-repentis]PZD32008.1 hypothetical protein A1F96_03189 [Pyrenophora tritici-repentis]